MLTISQLYSTWFVFWVTYFSVGILFSSNGTRTRKTITRTDITKRLLLNCLVTGGLIPYIYYIPQILFFGESWFGTILRFVIFPFLVEIWFYYGHRLMHNKYFYYWHKDHHDFIISYAYAGLYCSPVEMVFVNQLSISIPFQLLGFSFGEILLANIFVALNVLKGHAAFGYKEDSYKWLKEISHHDIHHRYLTYNYGILYLLDRMHNTFRENPCPK